MPSDIPHRIRRLYGIVILAFLALVGWQSYWHLAKSDWLLDQPSNRRLARAESRIPRGTVFDRTGAKIAWTADGKRQYADPIATAAVLGYMDPVYGRTGVEGEWDLELAGLSRTFDRAALHRLLANEKPRGNDLVLTLDLDLQQAASEALGARNGAVVVLDPATGGILALATYPTFDPRQLRDDYPALAGRRDGVLRNRATQDLYPPGSTMKVLTAAAALMHEVDPDTRYTCEGTVRIFGTKVTDFHGERHGTISMPAALAESCNNYFARTAAKLGQAAFYETAEAFGFNHRWWESKESLPDTRMLPIPLAESSLAPNPKKAQPKGELAHMGFGQSTVVATPLQMAMVSAAVANDGTLMAPYLVKAVRKGGTEQTIKTFTSNAIGYPLARERARELATMMRGVVNGRGGTGHGANLRNATVYGKTGTAEQTGGRDHAWFTGFAERERDGKTERIAFAVLIERGGTGASAAVPAARALLTHWAEAE